VDAPAAQGWWVDRAAIRETLTAHRRADGDSVVLLEDEHKKSSCIASMDWNSPSAFRFNPPREGS